MRISFLLSTLLLLTACGPMDDREDRTLAQGYTPCNDFPDPESGVICHPNQYCASQKLNWCHTGCLSDDNCSHEQTCVKSHNQNIGQCTDVSTLPDPDPDLDPGYTTCGDPSDPTHYEICHPSQYCYSDYLGDCSDGCLSEDNCTENQVCVKEPGENVGTCRADISAARRQTARRFGSSPMVAPNSMATRSGTSAGLTPAGEQT